MKSPVVQQDDYYPFGMSFNSYQRENGTVNQYLYNGKEKQDELDLGWMDYGARMYDNTIARWLTIDPKSYKYESYSPFNYVLNNPLSFIDPTGMEVESILGGYKYTGRDAKAAFSFIQSTFTGKKNAYVALIADKKLREKTNKTATGNGHGNWAVFAAKDLAEAANLTSVLPDKSLNNMVIETHGGAPKSGNNFLLLDPKEPIANSENSLTSTEISNHLAGEIDQDACNLQTIMNKVRDGGTVAFAACYLTKGTGGDKMLENLFQLSGSRLDIVGSTNYTRKDSEFLNYPNYGLQIGGSLSHPDVVETQWKGITSNGKLYHFSDVYINKWGSTPLDKKSND